MAHFCAGLNPSRTLTAKKLLSIDQFDSSLLSSSFFSVKVRKSNIKLPSLKVSASAMSSSQYDEPLSLESLTTSKRRDELMNAINSSLGNCLSETHLDSTVPGLKSKIRGKVTEKVSLDSIFPLLFFFFWVYIYIFFFCVCPLVLIED